MIAPALSLDTLQCKQLKPNQSSSEYPGQLYTLNESINTSADSNKA